MTLLSDVLVPFTPAHWDEMRSWADDHEPVALLDNAMSNALSMAAVVKTAMIDGRPEAIIGLWLTPDGGAPWIMYPALDADGLARVIAISHGFIEECQARCPLLETRFRTSGDARSLWLAGLGFRMVERSADGFETWRRVVER